MANSGPEAASVFPSVLRFLTLIYRLLEAIRADYCFLRIRRLRVRIFPPVLGNALGVMPRAFSIGRRSASTSSGYSSDTSRGG